MPITDLNDNELNPFYCVLNALLADYRLFKQLDTNLDGINQAYMYFVNLSNIYSQVRG